MGLGHGTSIVRNGLVLHLDAANQKSYPGSGTAWNDLSGKGNHASLIGNASYVTWNSSGYFNHNPGDVYFGASSDSTSGSTSFGAYWNIASASTLNPTAGWTVSGFLRILGSQSGNGVGWFVLDDADLRIHLEPLGTTFRASAGDGWSQIAYNVIPYFDKFTEYTFVFTQSLGIYGTDPGSLTLYINGTPVITDSSYTPVATTDYQISLGRRRGHFQHFMKADAATYLYYTRALTASEVKRNFEAQRGRYGL